MKLESYHYAWLSTHPERTQLWLATKLRDGFDVHHADGDHSNNSPDNLVLIEARDHMRLHNSPGLSSMLRRKTAEVDYADLCKTAYTIYSSAGPAGTTWAKVAQEIGWPGTWVSLNNWCGSYARENGLPWPIFERSIVSSERHKRRREVAAPVLS
jgi:hypothetical protein